MKIFGTASYETKVYMSAQNYTPKSVDPTIREAGGTRAMKKDEKIIASYYKNYTSLSSN